ncbi:MAG: hypothetical protein Q8Q04_03125, partial [archaeon]|nr:hypothetical protein [archaeon]
MEEISSNQGIEQEFEIKKSKILSKIQNFLKEPTNAVLVGVLLFAFIIRLYFFALTKSQPLWWDEAVYGSLAKNVLTSIWDGTDLINHESIIRPPLFVLAWAGLLLLKIPETATRFILEIIPSTLSVLFVYLIGKEIFNKKIGIFSAVIFS